MGDLQPPFSALKPSDSSKYSRVMENFKAAVLDRLAKLHPDKPLSAAQIAVVQRRLNETFPDFRTPSHPPYSLMIQDAVLGLNEEDGSRESAISDYILANYQGLPWAHKRFLSHYLDKLCRNGDLVCTSSKCYTIPDVINRRKWKKKKLRLKCGAEIKEFVIEEGNLGGNEVNVNETCFQKEDIQLLGKRSLTRRRKNLVVFDDDVEVGPTEVFGGEENVTEGRVIPLIGERKLILEPESCAEIDEEDSKVEQHQTGTGDDDYGGLVVELGTAAVQLVESTIEELPSKECQGEARTEDMLLDHDPTETKTEMLLSLVSSTMEKALPEEYEDEVRTRTLPLDHECNGIDLLLVPTECIKKSTPTPTMAATTLVSISNVDTPKDTFGKLALKENDRTADLMIVPFEGDSRKPAVVREIVCGLASLVPGQKNPKQVFRPRKRSKHCKEPLLSSEKWIPASPIFPMVMKQVAHEKLCEHSPPRNLETKAHTLSLHGDSLTFVPDGSIDHESVKHKLHSEFSHSCAQWKSLSKEDEDLNLPLQRVISACNQQRKFSLQALTSKAPLVSLASSMPGAKLQAQLPDSEDLAKTMAQIGEEMACNKKNQRKVGQQPEMQPPPQGQKHYNLEAVEGPQSEILSSFHLNGKGNNGQERYEDQDHLIPESVADARSENFAMRNWLQQQQEGHYPGSSPYVQLNVETLSLDDQRQVLAHECVSAERSFSQCHDGMADQKVKSQCPVAYHNPEPSADKVGEGNVNTLSESSQRQTKGLKQPGQQRPPKQKEATGNSVTGSLLLHNNHHQKQQGIHEPATKLITEEAVFMVCEFDQKKIREVKRDGCIESSKPVTTGALAFKENPTRQVPLIESPAAEPASWCHHDQVTDQQGRNGCVFVAQDLATTIGGEVLAFSQYYLQLNKQMKIEKHVQLQKEKDKTTDSAASLNLHHQQLHRFSESASHFQSQQQEEQLKQDSCGKRKKRKDATMEDVAAVNLHDQQQEGTFEPAICQQIKKDGRGRPRKQKEEKTEDVAISLKSHDQQIKGPSELATYKSKKKDGRGRPRKNVATQQDLEDQQREGSVQLAACHLGMSDGRGRPRRQIEAITDAVAQNLYDQQQDGPSELASHQLIKNDELRAPGEQTETASDGVAGMVNLHAEQKGVPSEPSTFQLKKKDGRGRPRKQKEMRSEPIAEDLAAPLNLHDQQLEGLCEPATSQAKKKGHRGRPGKQKEAIEGVLTSLTLLDQQLERPSKPITYQPKTKNGRRRPRKQTEATIEDVTAEINLQDLKQEMPVSTCLHVTQKQKLSELAIYQLRKKDGRGRSRKEKDATTEEVAAERSLCSRQHDCPSEPTTLPPEKRDAQERLRRPKETTSTHAAAMLKQQQEEPSELASFQMRKDGRGRPRNSKGDNVENVESAIHVDNQQEWSSKPAILSFLDASSVLHQLDEKKIDQQEIDCEVGCPDFGVSATLEQPVSLRTRSSLQQRKQKHDGRGAVHKPEFVATFSNSLTDHYYQEFKLNGLEKPPKSMPVPEFLDNESNQQEKGHKPDQEKTLQSIDEQPQETLGEVHGVPVETKQVPKLSDDQTSQPLEQREHGQDLNSVVTPLVNQPHQLEEEQCLHQEEKQGHELRIQGMVRKQKSAKTKSVQVPLSSKNHLRSRINHQP